MNAWPPRTKPPVSADSVTGAQIIPLTQCACILLMMNNRSGAVDYLVEYPIGAGFITIPGSDVAPPIVAPAGGWFPVGIAIGQFKPASGTQDFIWIELGSAFVAV